MSEQPDEDSARAAQERVQPFLDCVARLLARRWLREQRESTEEPPPTNDERPDEPPT